MLVPGLSIIFHKAVKPLGLLRNPMGHFRQLLPELHMLTGYIQRCLQQKNKLTVNCRTAALTGVDFTYGLRQKVGHHPGIGFTGIGFERIGLPEDVYANQLLQMSNPAYALYQTADLSPVHP
jgi:hypothetical protein